LLSERVTGGSVAYVPGAGENVGDGVGDVIASVQSAGTELSDGWKGPVGGSRSKIGTTFVVGFCAMSNRAPTVSVAAALLEAEASENSCPQELESPVVPPLELTQTDTILASVVSFCEGTVWPVGTPTPGVPPVPIFASSAAIVNAEAIN
jgi:hypothetical protein